MEQELWEKCVSFHGHQCPGLAIGFRAAEAGAFKLGIKFSPDEDEEIVCVTENDACGVDAVQVITGCTFGKGNLIYRNTGKMAFTFFQRSSGQKIRIVLKPLSKEMERKERQEYILQAPLEQLFIFKKPCFDLPPKARLFTTIICDKCGEGAAEHRMRLKEGKTLCLDCFDDYSRVW